MYQLHAVMRILNIRFSTLIIFPGFNLGGASIILEGRIDFWSEGKTIFFVSNVLYRKNLIVDTCHICIYLDGFVLLEWLGEDKSHLYRDGKWGLP